MTSFICAIYKEMIQMNLLTKQKDSQTQKMNLWLLGGRIGGRDNRGGWGGHVHTAVFSVNNQQGPTAQHMELCSVLCGSLDGRKVWGRMDTCISMAEPPYCSPETINSVKFSRSVMSNSLRPHELQHTRPPCPSQLPEFSPTHVRRVSDAIQPSHLLSSPSPPAPNPSQHESLFQ